MQNEIITITNTFGIGMIGLAAYTLIVSTFFMVEERAVSNFQPSGKLVRGSGNVPFTGYNWKLGNKYVKNFVSPMLSPFSDGSKMWWNETLFFSPPGFFFMKKKNVRPILHPWIIKKMATYYRHKNL